MKIVLWQLSRYFSFFLSISLCNSLFEGGYPSFLSYSLQFFFIVPHQVLFVRSFCFRFCIKRIIFALLRNESCIWRNDRLAPESFERFRILCRQISIRGLRIKMKTWLEFWTFRKHNCIFTFTIALPSISLLFWLFSIFFLYHFNPISLICIQPLLLFFYLFYIFDLWLN